MCGEQPGNISEADTVRWWRSCRRIAIIGRGGQHGSMDSRTGKQIRLGRIFDPSSGNSIIIAYSHGVLLGPLPGMTGLEEMRRMAGQLRQANGIMIAPGLVGKLEGTFVG